MHLDVPMIETNLNVFAKWIVIHLAMTLGQGNSLVPHEMGHFVPFFQKGLSLLNIDIDLRRKKSETWYLP